MIFVSILVTFLIPNKVNGGNASCLYKIIENEGYACNLSAIVSDSFFYDPMVEKFDEIQGEHVQGASDDNVTIIENSENFNTFYFPKIICEKFNNLQKIVIKNSEIENIPFGSLDKCVNLEIIQISSSKLKRLDFELLEKCEFLIELIIEDSDLRNIPGDLLISCLSLRTLNLSGNKLSFLNKNLLKNKENLEILNLSKNKIQGFPKNFFKNLKSLKKLDLSNNSIAILSLNWFTNLKNLAELNLSNNQIQHIPKSFVKSQINLQILDLSGNSISHIHADSFDIYPNITIVNNNGITGIEEKLVKNILRANKTLKIFKTICTRDWRNYFQYELPECQTNEELLEFLDNCFDKYEARNEDEG